MNHYFRLSKFVKEMNREELLYNIALTLINDIGDIRAKLLIAYCGSAEAVLKEKFDNLMKIPGVGTAVATAVKKSNVFDRAEREIEFIQKNNVRPLFFYG